jgi:hypothetical protein
MRCVFVRQTDRRRLSVSRPLFYRIFAPHRRGVSERHPSAFRVTRTSWMSVRTANRMLNRNSAALPARPFDACYGGSDHGGHGGLGGGHTLYSESGSQRSLGEFSHEGSQDDSLRRHSSHVPKPPLFNTPKHMYSGADTSQLPLDPGCLHHLLRKVGDHETTVKTQETSIRMLQDRLTRMGQSVIELTQSNAKRALPPVHRAHTRQPQGRACP